MSPPLWVTETATAFWNETGQAPEFPRCLLRPIALSLPLAVVHLPRLRIGEVEAWLNREGVVCRVDSVDRPLRACLVARCGTGIMFIDGADDESEQRFSVAHELAHFLRHYWHPRQSAADRLGTSILAVLDNQRRATDAERVAAMLARVDLGYQWHLMDRTFEGLLASERVRIVEDDADRLAFELLAPVDDVLRRARASEQGVSVNGLVVRHA